MGNEQIPFLDLVTPHKEMEEELVSVLRNALHSAAFIGGSAVENFEKGFAGFSAVKHCVGVANGTDALRFALLAAGVTAGDAVVTVPNTFIATTEAISQAGARPYFVDVDERTYNMDPVRLRTFLETKCSRNVNDEIITKDLGLRIKAIIPVHLYGQMADMDAITGDCGRVWADGDRGCLPGARSGILFEETQCLVKGRFGRICRCVQFLSGKESGGVRRSWRGDHQR